MEVLWVRWLGVQPNYHWGLKEARLPKVGFVPDSDDGAFGFLDPSLVLRGCHLIPVFAEGRTDSLLKHGKSLARPSGETDDWSAFYINIFADRDMFARFIGFGVGHKYQYRSEEMSAGNLQNEGPEDDNDPTSGDLLAETEQILSRSGEETRVNDSQEEDGREDLDHMNIIDVGEDDSEDDDDISEGEGEDDENDDSDRDEANEGDEGLDFEF